VHDVSSIARTYEVPLERTDSLVARGSKVDVAVRQFFRPYVLAFVALAVAVGGGSYGYKLTQYLQHSEVSRASYSRVWVDHRDDSKISPPEHHVLPDNLLALEPLIGPVPRDARPSRELVLVESSPSNEAFIFSALIPLRSPPVTNPSQA
jgi:hypothetical protein